MYVNRGEDACLKPVYSSAQLLILFLPLPNNLLPRQFHLMVENKKLGFTSSQYYFFLGGGAKNILEWRRLPTPDAYLVVLNSFPDGFNLIFNISIEVIVCNHFLRRKGLVSYSLTSHLTRFTQSIRISIPVHRHKLQVSHEIRHPCAIVDHEGQCHIQNAVTKYTTTRK